MRRVSAEILAGTEKMTRQKRYKVVRFRMGLCVNCGDKRGESPFKRVCEDCGESKKTRSRRKLGSKPWKLGSPGRPPLAVLQQQEEQ